MGNKLTDNETKKALECASYYDCDKCPHYQENCVDRIADRYELSKEALDLINRLEAENSNLTSNLTSLQNDLTSAKAEIERLNKEVDRLSQVVLYHDGQIVDAVKEFAERVDKEITDAIFANDKVIQARVTRYRLNRYEDDLCIMCDGKIRALDGIKCFIDNALKETVGE